MKVIELSNTNLDIKNKKIKNSSKNELNVLFIYANWCSHCISFKKIYAETASLVGSAITFYKLNYEKSPELVKTLSVQSFPSLYLVNKEGKIYKKFIGDRSTKEEFIGELCKLTIKCPKV